MTHNWVQYAKIQQIIDNLQKPTGGELVPGISFWHLIDHGTGGISCDLDTFITMKDNQENGIEFLR